jgi:hypothetical protein
MNDLEMLHDAWGAPDAPSYTARAEARSALLARAATARRRPRRLGLRLAAAGALGLMIAAGLAVLDDLGGTGPDGLSTVPVASAAVLERAAVAAEQKPFTPPRNDQWSYIEDRITSPDGDGEPTTRRIWRAADGSGMAWIEDGKLRVERMEGSKRRPLRVAIGPLAGYQTLAALPTDPGPLLRWAYRQAKHITGAGITEHGDVYAIFNNMLRENVLPPDLEAAIFRALKQVPDVTVDTINVGGRPALVVVQTEDWIHEELLLDAETYTYRGESGTVVRDDIIDPAKAGNATGEVEKGHKVVAERLVTAIVDQPGQRR